MNKMSFFAAASALALAASVHAAAPVNPFKSPPRLQGNGCSIHDSTIRALGSATPAQRATMDRARSDLDSQARALARSNANAAAAPLEITIPVVVHVVHDGGPENISDSQIIAAIDQMTEDFHAYPYAGGVDGYGYLQANVGFTFKLAKRDPQGRPHSGITRTRSTVTYNGSEGPLQATINWPREKYLNIWVVYSSDGANGSAYSNYPSTVADGTGIEYWDGIVVSYWAVGPSAVSGYEKILTHEAGHWADLIHTWGDTYDNGDTRACSDPVGDRVSDTPLTYGNTGCSGNYTCGYWANVENFMDYGSCTTMFTDGQSDRMQAALRSSVAGRSNVWSQANLVATGLATGNQPPAANFNYSASGQTVTFTDASSDADGSIASRSWSFGDGTSSTAVNPSKTYASTGAYNVTLTVTDNQGATNSTSKSVTVGGSTPTLTECTSSDTRQLGKNCTRSNRASSRGNYDYLYINLPAGVPRLKITVSGGTGNANLYVSPTTWATTSNYQYSSTNSGNSETLTINTPPSGYLYISLHAASAFSGATVVTEY